MIGKSGCQGKVKGTSPAKYSFTWLKQCQKKGHYTQVEHKINFADGLLLNVITFLLNDKPLKLTSKCIFCSFN